MRHEASIAINGTTLTNAQSMALRVAVNAFFAEMQKPSALGDDETGVAIAKGYRERCGEIVRMIGGADMAKASET